MDDNILKKLEQRLDRRGFLRGSGLAAAVIAGVAAFPVLASAQNPPPSDAKKDDKQDDKKDEKTADADKAGSDKPEETREARKEDPKDKPADPFKETKKDEKGRDYRLCPQCGYNMYKQDRTWTCENCGFSYDE